LDQFKLTVPVGLLLCCAAIWYWVEGDAIPIYGQLRLVVVIPIAVLLFTTAPFFQTAIAQRAAMVGNLTYALYLLHTPAALFVMVAFRSHGVEVPYFSPIFFLSFYGLLLPTAALVYFYFEAPAQNVLRSMFLQRNKIEAVS